MTKLFTQGLPLINIILCEWNLGGLYIMYTGWNASGAPPELRIAMRKSPVFFHPTFFHIYKLSPGCNWITHLQEVINKKANWINALFFSCKSKMIIQLHAKNWYYFIIPDVLNPKVSEPTSFKTYPPRNGCFSSSSFRLKKSGFPPHLDIQKKMSHEYSIFPYYGC